VILLDTHAVIWLERGYHRSRSLDGRSHLYISPASLLELQMLIESGRLRPRRGVTPSSVAADARWVVDDVPSARWFNAATEIGWTRDPFDRLLVAHARLRGWKLATADEVLLEGLGPSERLAL
jgi:PIN domain nuclease of toxin-antitoxin system